jgi:ATP-dependent RNA helicase RhlE
MEFQAFHFHPKVMAGIALAGYVSPTLIQAQAIPVIMEGRDVMGLAQTGTGKTASFVLPLLNRLMQGSRRCIRGLVIAPTRELAEQIHKAIGMLGQQTHLRSASIYGGVDMKPQIHKLRSGVEIIVACPGRLLDHMNRGVIDLSNIEVLVLDEADRMFDMGFLPDIKKILKNVPAKRQSLLFSATMPNDIRLLASETLRAPVTVQINPSAPVSTVAHALYPVDQHLKTALLLELLRHTKTESVLIFTRTKYRAKRVGQLLEKAGYRAASLQGNLSQNRRQAALDGFRDGSYKVLVATDIAARGIDVTRISHVINYDMPDTIDAYTHRIGRTGRAEKTGDAFTFITREDEDIVRSIERVLGEKVERRTMNGFDYKIRALANDMRFPRPMHEQQCDHKQNNNPGIINAAQQKQHQNKGGDAGKTHREKGRTHYS